MSLFAPSLRRWLAVAATATLTIGLSPLVAVGTAHATFAPALQCPPEQFPAAGAARGAASTPYRVPFDAELGVGPSAAGGSEGGYIVVNGSNGGGTGSTTTGALSVVLGPKNAEYTTGQLFGNACGYFSIPSLEGDIPAGTGAEPANPNYNHNFILHGPPFISTQDVLADPTDPTVQADLANEIPVAVEVPGTGVPLASLSGTGSADGDIANAIATTAAGNGGLNVSFDTSAKATATIDLKSTLSLLPTALTGSLQPGLLDALNSLVNQTANGMGPATCTLTIGDVGLTGYPPANVGPFTNPVHVSTDPTAPADKAAGAMPVTGPISNATGIAVSTGIVQPPIDPDTLPDVAAPGAGTTPPTTLCNPSVAELLNDLFGLPQAGSTQQVVADTFVAPVTFRAYTTQ
jgi:hypothetical protein